MAVFLITGTRKGIGRSLARHYLDQGHTVAGCSRGQASLDHRRYHHTCLDVADEAGVVKMVRSARRDLGGIDVLLNNAGIAAMNHIVSTPTSTVVKILSTNVVGTFIFIRECAKVMMKRGSGNIVNFATVATPLRLEGEAAYAASKAAVVNLTRIAAAELSAFGIRVNAVGPTPVKTDLIRGVPEDKIQALVERQAIQRLGEVEDIVNVIDFFIDRRSAFITGQVVYLGGVS